MGYLVEFTKDFATKKKGESAKYSAKLASHLVNKDKVAKYTNEQLDVFAAIKEKAVKQAKAQSERLAKIAKAKEARIAKIIKANKSKKSTKK